MATNEAVISSALSELKDFDVLQVVKPVRSFVPAAHLQHHYFRFYIHSLEKHVAKQAELVGKRSAAVGSSALDTVCVECTMRYLGEPLGPTISSSQSRTTRYLIDEWIEFPIKYCELPLDVEVVCEVKSSFGTVGSILFHPFTSRGELKTGPRRYPLLPESQQMEGQPGSSLHTTVPSDSVPSPLRKERRHYDVWELVSRERAHGRITEVPWLDKLADVKLAALREASANASSATAKSTSASAVLSVEFPIPSNSLPIFFTSIPRDHDADAAAYDVSPGPCVPFYDLDCRMENLSEAKASVLSRSLFLISDADAQPGFRERKWISAIIHRPLIQLDPPKVDDEAVLWKFRRFLTKDQKAFLPFMSCVDWDNRGERTEAERLMPLWKTISVGDALVCLSYVFRDTVSVRRFAVDRLSREPASTVLSFALQLVQAVRYDIQSELATFLTTVALQEWDVCCHVYWFMSVEVAVENSAPGGGSVPAGDASSGKIFTKAREAFSKTIEERNPTFYRQILDQVTLRQALTTLHMTIHRDKADRTKKMEIARELLRNQACGLRDAFLEGGDDAASSSRPPMTAATALSSPAQALTAVVQATQSTLTSVASPLMQLQRKPKLVTIPTHPKLFLSAVTDTGFYMFKSAKMPMKLYFVCSQQQEKQPSASSTQPHDGSVVGSKHSSSSVDKGRGDDDGVDIGAGHAGGNELSNHAHGNGGSPTSPSISASSGPTLFPIMFKCGDDVRQDQLVIQIIELMDRMLKDNGLDLCLTPYRVLAMSPNDGFMEIVPDVETFQSVQKDVIKYLSTHNKTPEKMAAAMERFVKSCAGYCVITFILGIGDRHLENLLITTDGRLLHIDFGFIFGNDPKPFPPPMKICKEMVDTMGGPQSQQYGHFKTYCCSAYNILRKHSSIIMATLLLMVDASIPQISGGSRRRQAGNVPALDPRVELVKVQDKFRLDLNNAEATQYIQNVIADSVGAIFTNLWDVIHIAAQAARH